MRTIRQVRRDAGCLRPGTVLIWFAVFLFALLPLMALVVHLGMATLSRRQMQTAVNSAALEGVRLSDALPDSERRSKVQDLVAAIYDDNLNSDTEDAMQFGAGPVIAFDDEPTDIVLPGTAFRASRTIRRENIGVYDPDLESNESNEQHGDMVAGQYQPTASHNEDATYSREDFLLDGDTGYNSTVGEDSFLVRLRRTRSTVNPVPVLDDVPGVSSTGPTVPFLFGRGPYGGPELLNRRERGTIVRATAIAQKQPAYRVGIPDGGLIPPLIGLLNVQMDIGVWAAGAPFNIGNNRAIEAQLFDPDLRRVTTVGEVPFEDAGASPSEEAGFVVLTDGNVLNSTGMPERRIVGFGFAVGVAFDGAQLTFMRTIPQPVAERNASATVIPPTDGAWDNLDLTSLFGVVRQHADNGLLLLAPALRRAVR